MSTDLPGLPPRVRPPAFDATGADAVFAAARSRHAAARRRTVVAAVAGASALSVAALASGGSGGTAGLRPVAPTTPPVPTATLTTSVSPAPLPATPTALPTTALPTTSPTALPSVPVPSVTLPPVPLPGDVPPPPQPTCEADAGSAPLPPSTRGIDVHDSGAGGAFVAEGRIWFSAGGDHVVGVDPTTGDRRVISTKAWPDAMLLDVAGGYAFTIEENFVGVYDASTGENLERWSPGSPPLYYEGGGSDTGLSPVAVTADAGGVWVLGTRNGNWVVTRMFYQGGWWDDWTTALPDPVATGYSAGRGLFMTDYGGSVYVGQQNATAAFWRLGPTGEVAAQERPSVKTANSLVYMDASASGVYARVMLRDTEYTEVLRLDPADLHVTGSYRARHVIDVFAGGDDVYVTNMSTCSLLLTRLDGTSMARTGFWRRQQGWSVAGGGAAGGGTWLLWSDGHRGVGLRRYDLP